MKIHPGSFNLLNCDKQEIRTGILKLFTYMVYDKSNGGITSETIKGKGVRVNG